MNRPRARWAILPALAWLAGVACSKAPPTNQLLPEAAADGGEPIATGSSARSLVGTDVPPHRVGMFYVVWHTPAVHAMKELGRRGVPQHTLETVLRSRGGVAFADVYRKHGIEAQAASFYWSARPERGFYCLYRARPDEAGHMPDCENIAETAAAHADALLAAGVDHVVVDATNLYDLGVASDLGQLRPTEVLFEEWAKLRAAGRRTPQIAIWAVNPSGAAHYRPHLALYTNPAYDGLVLRDARSGKKVYFVVDPPEPDADSVARRPDPQILTELRGAGLLVQPMWTLGATDPAADRWAFMAPCRSGGGPTTSVLGDAPCDQATTPVSSLGSAVAVAPSYQVNYGSLPNAAAGSFRGHTFRKQWATALQQMPDYVFVSGWNEHVSQPQVAKELAADPFAKSMGLERDPDGRELFVDTFGVEFSRDIEPTLEGGRAAYDLQASCARVFQKNAATGTRGCNDANEACCAKTPGDLYATVLAARGEAPEDVLLTTQRSELVASGYREVCARHGLPTAFCLRGDEPSTPLAPFVAFGSAGPGRAPLHRCLVAKRRFYSLDAGCEGQTFDGVVAYLAAAPTSEMPRRLERCFHPTTGEHTVAVGFDCPVGFTDVQTLGYVR